MCSSLLSMRECECLICKRCICSRKMKSCFCGNAFEIYLTANVIHTWNTDCICAAVCTVAEYVHIFFSSASCFVELFTRWCRRTGKFVLRNERNNVVNNRTCSSNSACSFFYICIVYSRHKHRIHFYKNVRCGNFSDSFKLVCNENLCRFNTFVYFSVVRNLSIKLSFHFGIYGVHGYRERVDSSINHFISFFRKKKTVCAHTFEQLREFFFHQAECLKRIVSGKCVTGTCNSYYGNFRTACKRFANYFCRFFRTNYRRCNTGPLFIIVDFPRAESALNVASRTDREMNAAFVQLATTEARVFLIDEFFRLHSKPHYN